MIRIVWLMLSATAAAGLPFPAAEAGAPSPPHEHPLLPLVRWAMQSLPSLANVHDYAAILAKRERVEGRLGAYEYLSLKIRHRPFSVYARFMAPAALQGQEVLYIEGQNSGRLWAHAPRSTYTYSLAPDSRIAMRSQRYPLTEIGFFTLTQRLLDVARQNLNDDQCEVRYHPGAKVNDRLCTCAEVLHPVPRRDSRFYCARIFVDNELQIPVRYESYDWPQQAGDEPQLIEEYTYLNLKLNNGFTDGDFSVRNPTYRFR